VCYDEHGKHDDCPEVGSHGIVLVGLVELFVSVNKRNDFFAGLSGVYILQTGEKKNYFAHLKSLMCIHE
jgi:hypothetical protein